MMCVCVCVCVYRIQQRLAALPPSVRHVIVLAGVPVIYPKLPVAESALMYLTGAHCDDLPHTGHAFSLSSPPMSARHTSSIHPGAPWLHLCQIPARVCLCVCVCVCRTGTGRTRAGVIQMLQKSGLADSLMSPFGTVEILDDLLDHWNADPHKHEKTSLVHMMQTLSLARGFRFSLLSGDVHVAAVGRFVSQPNKSLRQDHRCGTGAW